MTVARSKSLIATTFFVLAMTLYLPGNECMIPITNATPIEEQETLLLRAKDQDGFLRRKSITSPNTDEGFEGSRVHKHISLFI
jgi:hypothetical protein